MICYISSLFKVVIGGGQDASAVTTTDHRAGNFEAKFYDKVSVIIRGFCLKIATRNIE